MSKHKHVHEAEVCHCGCHGESHEHEEKCEGTCHCGHESQEQHKHREHCEESYCCGHESHEHSHEEGDSECGCGCGHHHEAEGSGNGHRRLIRYGLGAIPTVLAFLSPLPLPLRIAAACLSYLIFGYEVWKGMLRGFCRKRIFTEFTLMCVATVGAFAIGEYADAAAVMYLYSLGETLSDSAYTKSRRNLSELLEIAPEYAVVLRDGMARRVMPGEVAVGEVIRVTAGERIPLDGRVISGGGAADTSSVTGESKPQDLYEGVFCPSGAVLTDGSVDLAVTHSYENSVVTKLTRSVKEATKRKSAAEKKISRFARIFTPLAFAVSALIVLAGALLTGEFTTWLRMGLVVLVVSCPCSLVLSVPLTYFAGMGRGASRGIVFRGGEVMDVLCRVRGVALDKTGTVTECTLCFDGAEVCESVDRQDFLALSYAVLSHSPHAAARSFCLGWQGNGSSVSVTGAENIPGRGVRCVAEGASVCFGNAAFLRENGISVEDADTTVIFGAKDGVLLGRLHFSAPMKEGSAPAVQELFAEGVKRIAVLSGDGIGSVRTACENAGIREYYAALTPSDKVAVLARIAEEEKQKKRDAAVAFCGDGLNDSAVVAGADVGIAMGESGSALTVSSADVVLMDDDLRKIPEAIRIARKTSRVANENIALSLGIKIAVLGIGVVLSAVMGQGIPMELAIVADVGAAVLAVLNALRASR